MLQFEVCTDFFLSFFTKLWFIVTFLKVSFVLVRLMDTQENQWNACIQQDNIVASLLNGNDQEGRRIHRVLSNAFSTTQPLVPFNALTAELAPLPSPYTQAYLEEQTVPNLRALCTENRVKPSGRNKAALIQHMLEVLSPSNQSVFSHCLKDITDTSHAEPSPIHPFYKKNFNAVDLHDKQWYIIPWGFRINHWRIKMFIGQQKSALLNSWTLFNEFQRLPLIDFRLAIITHLLSANSD